MKSVLNVQIGKPIPIENGLRLPIAVDVTDDDSDDNDMPVVTYQVMQLMFSHRALAMGQANLCEEALMELGQVRMKYAASGYAKIEAALRAYLNKNDITKMAEPYIPEPDNRYIH